MKVMIVFLSFSNISNISIHKKKKFPVYLRRTRNVIYLEGNKKGKSKRREIIGLSVAHLFLKYHVGKNNPYFDNTEICLKISFSQQVIY